MPCPRCLLFLLNGESKQPKPISKTTRQYDNRKSDNRPYRGHVPAEYRKTGERTESQNFDSRKRALDFNRMATENKQLTIGKLRNTTKTRDRRLDVGSALRAHQLFLWSCEDLQVLLHRSNLRKQKRFQRNCEEEPDIETPGGLATWGDLTGLHRGFIQGKGPRTCASDESSKERRN